MYTLRLFFTFIILAPLNANAEQTFILPDRVGDKKSFGYPKWLKTLSKRQIMCCPHKKIISSTFRISGTGYIKGCKKLFFSKISLLKNATLHNRS